MKYMSLSNTVKTSLIDPRSHNAQRTEFKLDDAFYASSFKLIDLGLYDPNITDVTGAYYPAINGVMQAIRNILLYSDTTLIDSVQNVPQYTAMQALQCSNQVSEDLNRQQLLNGMGFMLNNTRVTDRVSGSLTLASNISPNYNTVNGAAAVNNQVTITNTSYDAQSGAVLLSQYLKFLQSTAILPMIPNLRLVIEWSLAAADYFLDPAQPGPGALSSLAPIRPTLIVDEILGMNPNDATAYQIPYMTTIVERFSVPATAIGNLLVPKQSSFKSQAFTQKFLRDLTFFNLPSTELADTAARWLTKSTRSVAQSGEVLQVVVNNSNFLPDRGINTEALKLHYFNDTQSQLNLPLACAMHETRDASGNIFSAETAPLVGQFSVTSVKIGTIVDSLQIEYSRLYGSSASSREAFTLLVFGTCAKTLSKKGNAVRVSY